MHGIFLRELVQGVNLVSGEENHHLRVKRIKPGEEVFLTDGRGNFCIGKVLEKGRELSKVLCPELKRAERRRTLALFLAIFDRTRMEWAVEKASELGASFIFPFPSLRSQQKKVNLERLRKKAVEAIKQSRNPFLPEIELLPSLQEALARAKDFEGKFFLHRGEERIRKFPSSSAFFIGPEGGWSDEELGFFQAAGLKGIGLGETVLRAETACVSISSLFMLI